MSVVELPALRGRNPLGLFAALGALDVASRRLPQAEVRLHWTDGLEPHAMLTGPDSVEHLVELCDADRGRWATAPVLTWGPDGVPLLDLKPSPADLALWLQVVRDAYLSTGDPVDVRLLAALVVQGAESGKGEAKPTQFHFTAGQQRFLRAVRELQSGLGAHQLTEALVGPWSYSSPLPVLGWDGRGERPWALGGGNPAKSGKLGNPGADWLAFLGLAFFPVVLRVDRSGRRRLVTTGCSGAWKSEVFRWPLWNAPLSSPVVASVLADARLVGLDPPGRARLGVSEMLQAGIRRSDQGGYGSFAPTLAAVAPRSSAGRQDRRMARRA